MRLLALMIGLLLGAAVLPHECGAQILDNPFSEYVERGVTIAPGAGNAKDANAAIHTIDPWPPYVGNTRIPGNGQCAVQAVEEMYRNPGPLPQVPGFSAGGVTGAAGSFASPTINVNTAPGGQAGGGGPAQPPGGC